jgi:hypothetical protein
MGARWLSVFDELPRQSTTFIAFNAGQPDQYHSLESALYRKQTRVRIRERWYASDLELIRNDTALLDTFHKE